jgi:hypothetical protein
MTLPQEPAQTALLSEAAPLLILQLSSALYLPGAWAVDNTADDEEWRWRSGISSWGWKAIEILTVTDEEEEDPRASATSPGKEISRGRMHFERSLRF